jgi:L-aspartate oxidase
VGELIEWGAAFDRDAKGRNGESGELLRTREGAHSLSRILHANGDATGREIAVSLLRHARVIPRIELMEWTTSVDLIVERECVVGATLLDGEGGLRVVQARSVLLASGGAGQVYSDTTNPAVATGDGIAMAYRAGAAVSDMEFYQFHPTAFSAPGAPRFLLSEALRGEGALLLRGMWWRGRLRTRGWTGESIWICGASESRKICGPGFRGSHRFWRSITLSWGGI